MQGQIRRFGLIGFPLGHSFSRSYFTGKFEREGLKSHLYENFEIPDIGHIREIIGRHPDLAGFNVTIPYKQSVIGYLDFTDPVARRIGAVNTVKIHRSGNQFELTGYNTDVTGFARSLASWPLNNTIRALVFGSGGSSLAVIYVLNQLGIEFIKVSRKKENGFIPYEAITGEIASDHLLWINCTPVGMFPNIDQRLALPYQYLTPHHYLFDLVYNPGITGFLKMGTDAGSSVMNGGRMLIEQAEASWDIWNSGSL